MARNSKANFGGSIGRLTFAPEIHRFENGGAVCSFNLAFEDKRNTKNEDGSWNTDGKACFIMAKIFNRGEFKIADIAFERLDKGHQVFITGNLSLETWTDKKSGDARSRIVIKVDDIEFLTAVEEQAEPKPKPVVTKKAPAKKTPQPQQELAEGEVQEEVTTSDIPF